MAGLARRLERLGRMGGRARAGKGGENCDKWGRCVKMGLSNFIEKKTNQYLQPIFLCEKCISLSSSLTAHIPTDQ